jgi:hypothetical protein
MRMLHKKKITGEKTGGGGGMHKFVAGADALRRDGSSFCEHASGGSAKSKTIAPSDLA